MGGLISLLFIWWYHEVFAEAARLSTALARDEDKKLFGETESYDGPKKEVRFSFDVGEMEPVWMRGYETIVKLLAKKGYVKGKDLEYVFEKGLHIRSGHGPGDSGGRFFLLYGR